MPGVLPVLSQLAMLLVTFVLFKAIDQARIVRLFDEHGDVAHFQSLQSQAPTDFAGNRSRYYFTPDYKVAQYYAGYAKRRVSCESVVIVTLRIPNAAIEP